MNSTDAQNDIPPPPPSAMAAPERQTDMDNINLLEYLYAIVKNKRWIILFTVFGLAFGYALALIKGPTWTSEAVIIAKESDTQKSPNISGFGAFGGIVASQLNIADNPGLDKIEIILDSKKFYSEVIKKYNLLPLIYKYSQPKKYREFYDTTKQEWSETFTKPNLLNVGNYLKGTYLQKEVKKNKTMLLSFQSGDSVFSDTLLSVTLTYLNSYIKNTVHKDAEDNVSYLENKLITISDPLLREKLQGMIASEMEKAMLVSNEAFRIIDPILTRKQYLEKKLYPLVFSFGFFFLSIVIFLVYHATVNNIKSEEDQNWIRKIKNELFH
jgi:hypothetical protein